MTFGEWDACVASGGCQEATGRVTKAGGEVGGPCIYVSWEDAQAYVTWLSEETGQDVPVTERSGVGVRGAGRERQPSI